MIDYNIELGKRFNINPYININNDKYSFVSGFSAFKNIETLNSIILYINIVNKENENSFKEIISTGQSFLRIWSDKVEFGQYDDNFFHEMEQFKDYVDEGEKIFGSISIEDFIEIIKEWRDFIIKCEEEKNGANDIDL